MEEKRKFIRFSVMLDGRVGVKGSKKPKSKCKIKDLSREGIRVTGPASINKGDILELELMLPGEVMPIIASGEVAWSKKMESKAYDVGMRLHLIDKYDRYRLLDYACDHWIKEKKTSKK